MRRREPQFFTWGCNIWRIFWDASCLPTLLFLPLQSTQTEILAPWYNIKTWPSLVIHSEFLFTFRLFIKVRTEYVKNNPLHVVLLEDDNQRQDGAIMIIITPLYTFYSRSTTAVTRWLLFFIYLFFLLLHNVLYFIRLRLVPASASTASLFSPS